MERISKREGIKDKHLACITYKQCETEKLNSLLCILHVKINLLSCVTLKTRHNLKI